MQLLDDLQLDDDQQIFADAVAEEPLIDLASPNTLTVVVIAAAVSAVISQVFISLGVTKKKLKIEVKKPEGVTVKQTNPDIPLHELLAKIESTKERLKEARKRADKAQVVADERPDDDELNDKALTLQQVLLATKTELQSLIKQSKSVKNSS